MSSRAVSHPQEQRDEMAMVKLGFTGRCMFFMVGFYKHGNGFDALKKSIRAVGQYNEFTPAKVLKALESVEDLIYSVKFGREYSPVMYIQPVNPDDIAAIIRAFGSALPDESGVQSDNLTCRFWWD